MFEMLEIMQKSILLIGLAYFARLDYHTKTIAILPIWLFGIGGVIFHFLVREYSVWNMLASMAIGGFLLLLSCLTAESIGFGDGLLFLVSGSYLSFLDNVELLIGTLFLLGGFAMVCLVGKRKAQGERIAMAPFMLGAYVIFVL